MSVYRLKLVDCITRLFSCKLQTKGACNCVCHGLIVLTDSLCCTNVVSCSFTFEPAHVCLLCQNNLTVQFVHPQSNLYSASNSDSTCRTVPEFFPQVTSRNCSKSSSRDVIRNMEAEKGSCLPVVLGLLK